MSYDLYLLAPVEGEDPMDTVERLEEADDRTAPGASDTIARLVEAIATDGTAYDRFPLDDGSVQLMEEEGLDVTVHGNRVFITFPYWDSLDGERLTREIDRVARAVGAVTGWSLYDPQIEDLVDPSEGGDAAAMREAFDGGRQVLREMIAEDRAATAAPETRPSRWKRLLGRRCPPPQPAAGLTNVV